MCSVALMKNWNDSISVKIILSKRQFNLGNKRSTLMQNRKGMPTTDNCRAHVQCLTVDGCRALLFSSKHKVAGLSLLLTTSKPCLDKCPMTSNDTEAEHKMKPNSKAQWREQRVPGAQRRLRFARSFLVSFETFHRCLWQWRWLEFGT